jgi:integrase
MSDNQKVNFIDLQYAIEKGMIDEQGILQKITMTKREEIEKRHPHPITEQKDGSWKTWVDDESKKSKQTWFHKAHKETVLDELIKWYEGADVNPTIADCGQKWLKDFQERAYADDRIGRKTTWSRYERQYKQFFIDSEVGVAFAKRKIKTLSDDDIHDFAIELQLKERYTENAFKKFWEVMGGIIDVCIDEYNIIFHKRDIKDKVKRSIIKKGITFKPTKDMLQAKEDAFFSVDGNESEKDRIIAFCEESGALVDLGIALSFSCGERPSELSALLKSDVANDFHYFMISKTEQRYKDKDTGKYVTEVYHTPKTEAGIRPVPIVDDTIIILQKICLQSNPDSPWLFSDSAYDRYKSAKFERRLQTICKKLNINQKSFTDIRHTYASQVEESELPEKSKAAVMGHKDIRTTRKNYSRDVHDIEYKRAALNKVFNKVM